MKTAIAYVSTHHGNTKKLVDAIAAKHEVTVIDANAQKEADLEEYDLIGYASGIAYGKFYPEILEFMEKNAPANKKVFFLHTSGNPFDRYDIAAKAICEGRGCESLGTYFCKGFDTFGALKLVGGIAKGHPTDEEIEGAVKFFEGLDK